MPKVIVKDGDLNDALKKFSRIASETRKVKSRHDYYLRPGLRKKEKSKLAQKYRNKKCR